MKTTDKSDNETFKERFTKLFPQPEPKESQVDEKIDMVLYSRIMDSVHKSLEWEDGEITGIQIDKLEQKIKGILKGFTITPKP